MMVGLTHERSQISFSATKRSALIDVAFSTKMEMKTNAELTYYAIRNGLVE